MKKGRKNFLIYPKFQLAIVGVNLFAILLAMGFVFFHIMTIYGEFQEMGLRINLPKDHYFYQMMDLKQAELLQQTILAILGALLLSGMLTLMMSHKIAGPIVRLISYFKEIKETGKYQHLKFRKNDFFLELPPEINESLDKISGKSDQ